MPGKEEKPKAGADQSLDRNPESVEATEGERRVPDVDPEVALQTRERDLAQVRSKAERDNEDEGEEDSQDEKDTAGEDEGDEDAAKAKAEADVDALHDEDDGEKTDPDKDKKADADKDEDPEADEFDWDELADYFQDAVDKNKGKIGFMTVFSTLIHAWKMFRGKADPRAEKDDEVADEDSIDGPDGTRYRMEDDYMPKDDPQFEKLKQQALAKLEKVKDEHEDWLTSVDEASKRYNLGPQGPAVMKAMINAESGWNPEAKNPGSSAKGLGQFIDGTWDSFKKSLGSDDPLKESKSTDPQAAITGVAWYMGEIMKDLNLDPNDPHLASKVYMAFHEGTTGAKTMNTFNEKGKPEGRVPKSYLGKEFPKFGIAKVENYTDYARLVGEFGARIEAVAHVYGGKESEPNS